MLAYNEALRVWISPLLRLILIAKVLYRMLNIANLAIISTLKPCFVHRIAGCYVQTSHNSPHAGADSRDYYYLPRTSLSSSRAILSSEISSIIFSLRRDPARCPSSQQLFLHQRSLLNRTSSGPDQPAATISVHTPDFEVASASERWPQTDFLMLNHVTANLQLTALHYKLTYLHFIHRLLHLPTSYKVKFLIYILHTPYQLQYTFTIKNYMSRLCWTIARLLHKPPNPPLLAPDTFLPRTTRSLPNILIYFIFFNIYQTLSSTNLYFSLQTSYFVYNQTFLPPQIPQYVHLTSPVCYPTHHKHSLSSPTADTSQTTYNCIKTRSMISCAIFPFAHPQLPIYHLRLSSTQQNQLALLILYPPTNYLYNAYSLHTCPIQEIFTHPAATATYTQILTTMTTYHKTELQLSTPSTYTPPNQTPTEITSLPI